MFKNLFLIIFISILSINKIYAKNDIFIYATIDQDIITNFDIKKETEYLKILNPGLTEISEDKINIKGKTTEKLGVIGKEKAIATEVIVSVIKYD